MSLKVDIRKNLKNFSLNIKFETNGTPLGILGASGCGKSMTLKCIAGIMTPDSGHISYNGKILFDSEKKINLRSQERSVGYLFQNYALFPNLTVAENIGISVKGNKKEKADLINHMLSFFRLEGLENSYPYKLSGGQQQRVALARMLAYKPDLLLFDEPFSALDMYLKEGLQLELGRLLKDFRGESILVTHDRDEVYKLCNQLLIMESGEKLCNGDTKAIFLKPKKTQAARLTGCKNISPIKKISENTCLALDWNITFTTAEVIKNEITHIGIRAHDFIAREKEAVKNKNLLNIIPAEVQEYIEAPFEWNLLMKTKGLPLYWKIEKSSLTSNTEKINTKYISINPREILLLEN
jgi:ABC-type sulfate/molybdate transport systems, ATPase component